MTDRGPSIAEIKAALQARAGELWRQLAPGGAEQGGIYTPLNPTRVDRHPGSFVIWLRGEAAGAYKDFATGDKGDILGGISYCLNLDTRGALEWAKRWLGIAPGVARLPARKPMPAPQPGEDDARKGKRIGRARALWLEAKPGITEYPLACRYFASRGIELSRFAGALNALRFAPNCYYDEDRKFPAIVACMNATEGGGIVAVHRTYLAHDGSGKAPMTPARKMLGPAQGAVIAIWRGQSELPVRQANEAGIADTLVLTEGIEDALSVAVSAPDCRVWAVGSLGNLAAITLPACAHDVVVFADNDWAKPEAQAQLAKGLRALGYQNRRVRVAHSPEGKDVNDLLRGGLAA